MGENHEGKEGTPGERQDDEKADHEVGEEDLIAAEAYWNVEADLSRWKQGLDAWNSASACSASQARGKGGDGHAGQGAGKGGRQGKGGKDRESCT